MTKKPKLWFFDIDGTLNKTSFSILKNSQNTLFSFVTGRGFIRSKEFANRGFPLGTYMILECGGRITDLKGNDLVNFPFSKKSAKEAFRIAKEEFLQNNLEYIGFFGLTGHKYFIFCPDKIIGERLKDKYPTLIRKLSDSLEELYEIFLKSGCVKFTIKLYSGSLPIQQNINCAKNDSEFSITEKNINKASGILQMSKILKIPLSQIGIAGNDFNDIPMFKLPLPVKIAVGNKCEEINRLATHQVKYKSALPKILETLI